MVNIFKKKNDNRLLETIGKKWKNYLTVIIVAPLTYSLLGLLFHIDLTWFGIILSSILGAIVYTILNTKIV